MNFETDFGDLEAQQLDRASDLIGPHDKSVKAKV
jgi:hypothetical protein